MDILQLSRNPSQFDEASDLLMDKWQQISVELVNFFENEWLHQNRNWYEGFSKRTPSQNNALESRNNVIKNEQTLRERLDLSQFRVVLLGMVHQWSTEYVNGLNEMNFDAPKIELKHWTAGYNFARSNFNITSNEIEDKIVYTISLNDKITPDHEWNSFKEFKETEFSFVHTSFDNPVTSENWQNGDCDCPDFFKLFVCEHLIGIALGLKVISAPVEAKTIPIGQKRKRGRPQKSKTALVIQ